MSDSVKIKLNIAGRQYPLSITPEEEETIRKTGKTINEMIKGFENQYETRDKQDALAMCALQLGAKAIQHERTGQVDSEKTNQRLQDLIEKIQKSIRENR